MTSLHKQLQGHISCRVHLIMQWLWWLSVISVTVMAVPANDFYVCAGCYKITTVFSHAQTVVLCVGCSTVLCQPTGGKARLTEGTGKPACAVFHFLWFI